MDEFIGMIFPFVLIGMLISVIAMWRIFNKLGHCGLWAFVPFVNVIMLYKAVWGTGWAVFLPLIPFIGCIFPFVTRYKLYRGFGKGVMFSLFGLLLPPVADLIVAFGSAEWNG